MKTSFIFNQQQPSPLDVHMRKIFKQFEELQQRVVKNWKQDVAAHNLGHREFQDIRDVRPHVSKNGMLTVTLKPFIGIDTQDELRYFASLFTFYKLLHDDLYELLEDTIGHRKAQRAFFPGKAEAEIKLWKARNDYKIHSLIMMLFLITCAASDGVLQQGDLDVLEGAYDRDEHFFHNPKTVHQLIENWKLLWKLSDKYPEEHTWYDRPQSDLVSAFYRNAERRAMLKHSR